MAEKSKFQQRMEAWQKYAGPGPEHQRLGVAVGHWTVAMKMYGEPDQPPMESRGDSEYAWVLGGTHLQETFRADMGGQPYQGLGQLGYDRLKREYYQTWIDSMATGCMFMTGQADADGRTLNLSGETVDVLTGERGRIRSVLRITPERIEMKMWGPGDDGGERIMMDLVYTRR